jgi:uncharacterized membrane protein YbaN (DUF454 family)
MLLFEQQVEFIQPVLPGMVFILIIAQRLEKPDKSYSTFMLYRIAHFGILS